MDYLFKLPIIQEAQTGLYVCLVGLKYWRGPIRLKRKFSTKEEAVEYQLSFIDRYNRQVAKERGISKARLKENNP